LLQTSGLPVYWTLVAELLFVNGQKTNVCSEPHIEQMNDLTQRSEKQFEININSHKK